jgi:hypothetical protein
VISISRDRKIIKPKKAKPPKEKNPPPQNQKNRSIPPPDAPPPSLKKIRGGKRFRQIQTVAILLLIAVMAGTLVFLDSRAPGGLVEWTKDYVATLGGGNGFPVEVQGGEIKSAKTVGGDVFVLTESVAACYSQNGKKVYSRLHNQQNPSFSVSRTRLLVYDRGGRKYRIENREKTLAEADTEFAIFSAAVSESGSYAVAFDVHRSACEVVFYDRHNAKLFIYSLAENMTSGLALSKDGKTAAIAAVGVKDGDYQSLVYIMDIERQVCVKTVEFPGSLIFAVRFNEKGNLTALADNVISVFTPSGGDKHDYRFQGELAWKEQGGENTAAIVRDIGLAQSKAVVISGEGAVLCEQKVSMETRSVAAGSDSLFCLAGSVLTEYDFHGAVKKTWDCETAPLAVTAYKNTRALVSYNQSMKIFE